MNEPKLLIATVLILSITFYWYFYTNDNIEIIPMGYQGKCIENNSVGECRIYLVKNFDLLHLERNMNSVKSHALKVFNQNPQEQRQNIYYFRETRWTKENMKSVSTNSMEELSMWDKDIHPIFPEMSDSFLCTISLNSHLKNANNVFVNKKFRYGNGYLECFP